MCTVNNETEIEIHFCINTMCKKNKNNDTSNIYTCTNITLHLHYITLVP